MLNSGKTVLRRKRDRAGEKQSAKSATLRAMATRRRPESAEREVLELFVLAPEADSSSPLMLASFRNANVLAPFPRAGAEAGARWQRIIRVHERILGSLEGRSDLELPRGPELRSFGRDLFETLFPGDVKRLYDTARTFQRDGVLEVVFTSMIDWVADKPWELAFDPSRREFLGISCVNLVRNAYTAVPAELPARKRGRLNLLVVTSSPEGVPPVAAHEETARLRASFHKLLDAGLANVELLRHATPQRLQRRLAEGGLDVLHFIGHGQYEAESASGFVLFEDDRARPKLLPFDSFRQIVCRRGLRLVFLNACETGRGGRADWNRGMAPALLAAGVPAVVANQYAVLDVAATAFACDFYAQLARGRSLGDAAREARLALARELGTESLEWAVPVLFARDSRKPFR